MPAADYSAPGNSYIGGRRMARVSGSITRLLFHRATFCLLLGSLLSFYACALAAAAGRAGRDHPYRTWSILHRSAGSSASIYYPQLENLSVDSELAFWADERLRAFVGGVERLNGAYSSRFSLYIDYEISQASADYLSVIFRIKAHTGEYGPDSGMTTFTYDLRNGRALGLRDLVGKEDGLLNFLSDYAREELLARLGRENEDLIRRGTAPTESNFACFALSTSGLDIFFPPYQVDFSSQGEQRLRLSLEKLAPFRPRLEIWNRRHARFAVSP